METELTGVKKWVAIILAVGVVALALTGTFVPEARTYIVEAVKLVLNGIAGIAK